MTAHVAHTPGPWQVIGGKCLAGVIAPSCQIYLHDARPDMFHSLPRWQATATRIVTCVNAMEGLSNEQVAALRSERDKLEAEINRRKGDPSTRLHNLCEAIAEEAHESAYSREEWERIDAENAKLRADVAALRKSHADLLEALEVLIEAPTFGAYREQASAAISAAKEIAK